MIKGYKQNNGDGGGGGREGEDEEDEETRILYREVRPESRDPPCHHGSSPLVGGNESRT